MHSSFNKKAGMASKPYPQFFFSNLQFIKRKFHAFQDQLISCPTCFATYAIQSFHQFNRHTATDNRILAICPFRPNDKLVLCHSHHLCKLIDTLYPIICSFCILQRFTSRLNCDILLISAKFDFWRL